MPPGTAESKVADDTGKAAAARSTSVGNLKPSFNPSVEKFKKNNLTASNPIIGAPLGDNKSASLKVFPKLQAGGAPRQSKIEIGSASASKLPPTGGIQMSKPTMGGSANIKPGGALPKFPVKKTIKFAKDTEGGMTPANNDQ